ncbi:reverse transcriptase domain-containing protein [Tanacetum coccineum]
MEAQYGKFLDMIRAVRINVPLVDVLAGMPNYGKFLKELIRVGSERMIFHIDSAMKHSYSNDDTCFSIDVIDEILEEYFDALLDEGSKIFHSIKGTILKEELFAEFHEFIAMTANDNSETESESDEKELQFEKITINTEYKIKTNVSLLYPISGNFVVKRGFQPERLAQHCKDAHLVLNWEKCHFMVKEGIVLGHKVSKVGLEVDKVKINVISKLPPPTNVKDHSALRHLFKNQDAKPRLISWIVLLQEFDIKIKDKKGTENVAADHLSQFENDETSDDSELDDNFPEETLIKINTIDEPWFEDSANYLGSEHSPRSCQSYPHDYLIIGEHLMAVGLILGITRIASVAIRCEALYFLSENGPCGFIKKGIGLGHWAFDLVMDPGMHPIVTFPLRHDFGGVTPFVANGVTYRSGYSLVDRIYPKLAPLIKTIPEPADDDHKRILYKQKQESARKNVERAFGVLKKKWAILANHTRALKKERIVNMILIGTRLRVKGVLQVPLEDKQGKQCIELRVLKVLHVRNLPGFNLLCFNIGVVFCLSLWLHVLIMEKGFLSQKGRWRGKGVKEMESSLSGDPNVVINSSSVVGNGVMSDLHASGEFSVHGNESGKLNSSLTGNIPLPMSFANLVEGDSRHKTVNFRPLFTPAGNGMDVYVSKESVSVVNNRFNDTICGFFLGKRVAYLVVENYVKNTWTKFGLVKSRMIKDMFFLKFGSKEGMKAMLESGPWLIRNLPLILKQWTPDVNIMKEDVSDIHVWVKFHDVPIIAFTEDGLSAIATKLGNLFVLDSYMAAMCTNSWGRASYARAMVERKADVELRDTIVVTVSKFSGVGFILSTIYVEYEWAPPRCLGCKFFGHVLDECCKKIALDISNNSKIVRQPAHGPPVQTANKATTPTLNSFNALSTLVDEEEGGGNQTPSSNSTHVVARINDLERQMLDGKLVFVDDHEKPLEIEDEVEMPDDETSKYMSSTGGGGGLFEDDLDFYDRYETQVYDLPEQMQTFCDHFDILIRSCVGSIFPSLRLFIRSACLSYDCLGLKHN